MKIINLSKDKTFVEPLVDKNTEGLELISLNPSGSGDSTLVLQDNKVANPTTSFQSITPDEGYNALGSVTLNPVTSSIDSNIKPENIAQGVNILGVQGTAKGFSSYGFEDLGYNADESFEAYSAYLLANGSDQGLEQAIYDASTAYSSIDNPLNLSPEQFDTLTESTGPLASLMFFPKIQIGQEWHNQESWTVSPYENAFMEFKACYYPILRIVAPTSGISLNAMFKSNKNVTYIHKIGFGAPEVGESLITAREMFKDCHNLLEIHVKGGNGSIFNNSNISDATEMFKYCFKMIMPNIVEWNRVTTMESAFMMSDSNDGDMVQTKNSFIDVEAPLCTNFSNAFREWNVPNGFKFTVHSDTPVQNIEYMLRQINDINGYTSNGYIADLDFHMAQGSSAFQLATFSKCIKMHFRQGLMGVTNAKEMFYGCSFSGEATIDSSLEGQGLDLSSIETDDGMTGAFDDAGFKKLNGLGAVKVNFQINNAQLPVENLRTIIQQLHDFSQDEGASGKTFGLGSQMYDLLEPEDLALASSKLWTITRI